MGVETGRSVQRLSRSPAAHLLKRSAVKAAAACLFFFPPLGGGSKTALGNMRSSVQESRVLLEQTVARHRVRAWAQAARQRLGMCLSVLALVAKMSLRGGNAEPEVAEV